MHHHPEDGMDIKKLFDFVPNDQQVKEFFLTLQRQSEVFNCFVDLPDFAEFMYQSAGKNYDLKDACLLKIIGGIQTADHKQAGLNLITYLLAPGLQNILVKSVFNDDDSTEVWPTLWSELFQSIQRYPLANRPHKVAANLLLDTLNRIRNVRQTENSWLQQKVTIESQEVKTDNDESSSFYQFASALLAGSDCAGLNKIDLDLVISSRVYDESMKSVAQRLGLDYHNALKRRYRAEAHLRSYWRRKIDND